MKEQRGSFNSRLGFILVSAGCAIGIGNVWKFPYVAGENGGAVFVLFYLLFLLIMGIPVMTMELAMGRASSLTIVKAYRKLEKPGSKWHVHGWAATAGCYILMMYYTTVSGWMLDYFFKFATGRFDGATSADVAPIYNELMLSPVEMSIFTLITVVFGFSVIALGVQKGLERVNKFMMLGLLSLIIILAVKSLTLSGAAEGVRFFLLPDFKQASSVGLHKVIAAAMNQAFFTLSVGMGSIEVFGSYMPRNHALTGEATRIAALDTLVAVISGLIIFPACFSYGVEPSQGPSLIFITLPQIFINMPFGRFWGSLFFAFMTFASFSTVTAVFENLVSTANDNFKLKRGLSVFLNCLFMMIASIPCVLGYNIWSKVRFAGDRNVLDFEDFLVSNLILPIGALIFVLFCAHKFGWGFGKYLEETNTGEGVRMPAFVKGYMKYVLPLLILIVIIQGLF
jgi:NSS family neurotransmitter:Na+ symporter